MERCREGFWAEVWGSEGAQSLARGYSYQPSGNVASAVRTALCVERATTLARIQPPRQEEGKGPQLLFPIVF